MNTENNLLTDLLRLEELIGRGLLWRTAPDTGFDKCALTDDGKEVIAQVVRHCLQSGRIPNCAMSGEDGRADADIISLSRFELTNLLMFVSKVQG